MSCSEINPRVKTSRDLLSSKIEIFLLAGSGFMIILTSLSKVAKLT